MAKYRENFTLSPTDIEIIESAIRAEIAACSRLAWHSPGPHPHHERVRELNLVLGRLFNQKVFYAQVNDTHSPVA